MLVKGMTAQHPSVGMMLILLPVFSLATPELLEGTKVFHQPNSYCFLVNVIWKIDSMIIK